MYKPIIEIIDHMPQYIHDRDKYIMEAVLQTDIKVDKQELILALKYDRGQYEKGYKDGATSDRKTYWIETPEEYYAAAVAKGKRYEDTEYFYEKDHAACAECLHRFWHMQIEGIEDWRFCPVCGAEFEDKDVRGVT